MSGNVVIVECRGVEKYYPAGETRLKVLDGVDLQLRQGTLTALLGASGSGKSTLLNCLAGLDSLDAGRIEINGCEVSRLNAEDYAKFRLATIGLVFQFFNLLPTLTVYENVALPRFLQRDRQEAIDDAVAEVLELVGIGDKARRYPHELSGGEVQRAAIARALINRPALVLADEPTGSLDEDSARQVIELFRSLVELRQTTVLMVTHNPENARAADVVLRLQQGKVQPGESGGR